MPQLILDSQADWQRGEAQNLDLIGSPGDLKLARKNLIANPSFETDSDGDGLADNWLRGNRTGAAHTVRRDAGRYGAYSQVMEKTDWTAQGADLYSIIAHVLQWDRMVGRRAVGARRGGDAVF